MYESWAGLIKTVWCVHDFIVWIVFEIFDLVLIIVEADDCSKAVDLSYEKENET